jgi:ribulose-phosphate 3-epimerase
MGPLIVNAVRRSTILPVEAHLMISHPEQFIEAFATAGADYVIIHQEVSPHLHRIIQQIKAVGKMAGIALNPSTPVMMLEDILSMLDMVLIMTVNPGFGGQKFIPETLPKIKRLREMIDLQEIHCDIEVDGGIHETVVPLVVQAGANLLVAGSAVYNEHESVAEAIARLRNAV